MIRTSSLILALSATLVACNQAPSPQPQVPEVKSVDNAAQPPSSEDPSQRVQIFYAQTGVELTAERLINSPVATVSSSQDFYALGVFKGVADVDSTVDLRIVDSSGNEVYRARQTFRPSGENPVLFEIKASDAALGRADYRIFFDLDGAPCWELPLTVS